MINTLVLSVYERTRELGMLRAVGMSRRQVRRMVRHESVDHRADRRRARAPGRRHPRRGGHARAVEVRRRVRGVDPEPRRVHGRGDRSGHPRGDRSRPAGVEAQRAGGAAVRVGFVRVRALCRVAKRGGGRRPPPRLHWAERDVAQPGRALALGARSRRSESGRPDYRPPRSGPRTWRASPTCCCPRPGLIP